jgi:hypothetical protein
MLGGGINMDAVIYHVWITSESMIVDNFWDSEHEKKCSSETAAMISLWKCSSSY